MKRLLLFPALLFGLTSAHAQITVSGRVATADGAQLPDKVVIQRDCGGAPQTAAYTDRKGLFSFRWSDSGVRLRDDASQSIAPGVPRGVPGDGIGQGSTAQERGAGGESATTGCRLRAAASGYRSEVIPLDNNWEWLRGLVRSSLCVDAGFAQGDLLIKALEHTRAVLPDHMFGLLRFFSLELWLRGIEGISVVPDASSRVTWVGRKGGDNNGGHVSWD